MPSWLENLAAGVNGALENIITEKGKGNRLPAKKARGEKGAVPTTEALTPEACDWV